jgi:hypothetical protein
MDISSLSQLTTREPSYVISKLVSDMSMTDNVLRLEIGKEYKETEGTHPVVNYGRYFLTVRYEL